MTHSLGAKGGISDWEPSLVKKPFKRHKAIGSPKMLRLESKDCSKVWLEMFKFGGKGRASMCRWGVIGWSKHRTKDLGSISTNLMENWNRFSPTLFEVEIGALEFGIVLFHGTSMGALTANLLKAVASSAGVFGSVMIWVGRWRQEGENARRDSKDEERRRDFPFLLFAPSTIVSSRWIRLLDLIHLAWLAG